MAIGRINGPMLYNNLERLGIDLAIDGNLTYYDVTNRRVGINNSTPGYSLDSPGNVRLANLTVTHNRITSNTGKVSLGSISNVYISGGSAVDNIIYTDGSGNLNYANINTLVSQVLLGNTITGNVGNARMAWTVNTQSSTSNTTYYPTFTTGQVGNLSPWTNSQYTFNPGTGILTVPNIISYTSNVSYGNILSLNVGQGFYSPNVYISGGYITNLANISGNLSTFTTSNVDTHNVFKTLTANNIVVSNIAINGNSSGTFSTANISLFENITNTSANQTFYPGFYDTTGTGNAQIYVNANISYNPAAGNLTTINVKANSNLTSDVLVVNYVQPQDVIAVEFVGNAAVRIPSGTTLERPMSPGLGYLRHNFDLDRLEYYNGHDWVVVQFTPPSVSSQIFYADGVSTSYTLNSDIETDETVLVNVNGTTQVPGTAYTVSGNVITFAETLNNTDLIDIRFLSVVTSDEMLTESTVPFTSVGTQVIDKFWANQARTVKYQIQVVDYGYSPNRFHVTELLLTHDNSPMTQIYITEYATLQNTGQLGTFSTTNSAGMIVLSFTPNYDPEEMVVRLVKISMGL